MEGGALGHEGGTLMSEISTLYKEPQRALFTPSAMYGHSKKALAMDQEESSHQTMLEP